MHNLIKQKLFKLKKIAYKALEFYRSYRPARYDWGGATVCEGAIIEGDPAKISLGTDCVVEPGAVLSTIHGGNITLGQKCVVHRGAMILTYGGNIVLGNHCTVNPYSILYGHGGLKIGDYVRFAAHCVVISANHGFNSLDLPICKQPLSKKGIEIGDDVWFGANVCVLDGVHIGSGAIIGASSVVNKDIAPFCIAIGNPVRQIRSRKHLSNQHERI